MSNKKLVRNTSEQMLAGVAAGIADYFNIDPVIVRLIFVLMFLTGGHGLLVYIVLAIIMPADEPNDPVSAKANAFDEEEIVIKS